MKEYVKPSFAVKSLVPNETIADQLGDEHPISTPQGWIPDDSE